MHASRLRAEFRVMGSAAEVEVLGGDESLLALAERRLRHLERSWSRFIVTSDISRLNAAGGAPIEVDPSTITLLEAMVHGHHATGGAFDPTVLATVCDLGYAASRHDATMRVPLPTGVGARGDLSSIEVVRGAEDADGRIIGTCVARLPIGTAIDPGGIGKGLAADLVAHDLLRAGAEGAMVSVGGDLRVAGHGPNDGDWVIAILSDPETPPPSSTVEATSVAARRIVDHVRLRDGGVATSGTIHHQVDPRRARHPEFDSDGSRPVQASVVAGSAMWAEVCATWAMVGGRAVFDDLDRSPIAARLQFADGSVATTTTWHRCAVVIGGETESMAGDEEGASCSIRS